MLLHSRSAIALVVAVTAVGVGACSQAASDVDADGQHEGESSAALSANDKTAFDYFLAKGLTPVQAAGIVGNLDQESNVDPGAVQPGGPGRGIAQWSVGGRWNHDAGDNAVAYATSHGKSVTSLGLQLDFIWFELTTFSGYGLSALKKATTVSAATLAFMTDFEACGACLSSQRISYAQTALTAYGNDHVDAGAGAAPKPDAGHADGGGAVHADGGVSGDAGEPADPGDPGATDDGGTGGGPSAAPHDPSAAEGPANEPAADQGGCAVSSARHAHSSSGVSAAWLASMAAAAAMVLARRRRRA
jgi:hypothetical protein